MNVLRSSSRVNVRCIPSGLSGPQTKQVFVGSLTLRVSWPWIFPVMGMIKPQPQRTNRTLGFSETWKGMLYTYRFPVFCRRHAPAKLHRSFGKNAPQDNKVFSIGDSMRSPAIVPILVILTAVQLIAQSTQ